MCQTFQVLFCLVLRFIVFFAYVGIENGSFYRHLPYIAKLRVDFTSQSMMNEMGMLNDR